MASYLLLLARVVMEDDDCMLREATKNSACTGTHFLGTSWGRGATRNPVSQATRKPINTACNTLLERIESFSSLMCWDLHFVITF